MHGLCSKENDVMLQISAATGEVNARLGWTQEKEVGMDPSLPLCLVRRDCFLRSAGSGLRNYRFSML